MNGIAHQRCGFTGTGEGLYQKLVGGRVDEGLVHLSPLHASLLQVFLEA